MKRIAHAAAACAAALLLGACATGTLTRIAYANAALAYSNLGSMLTWMADDYVDLTGAQEDWVRSRIARVLQWHRTQELPKYAAFLETALGRVEGPLAAQDVAELNQSLRAHYFRLVERVVPDLAEFLAHVEAGQVAQLERKFAEDNARFARESIKGNPDERRAKRMRRFIDHLEAWIGPISAGQRELLAVHYATLPDLSQEMLGERRYRQGEIVALVKAPPPAEQMNAQLRRLLVDAESWRRPDYQEKLRQRDARAFEMLAALATTLSPAQRAALHKRIRGFIGDIATLTASS